MHRIPVTVILILAAQSLALAQPGRSGMPLLKLGVTARVVAMGYTSALAEGPAAVQGNPAGFASGGQSTRLLFTHQEWIQDVRTEFLGASTFLGERDALGFSLLTTTVSEIEIRTRPGTSEGTFTSRDLAVGLSYARGLSPGLTAGVSGRFLYQKLLVHEATGYSFDAGLRLLLPIQGAEAGLALLNIGRMSLLNLQRTKLPALARLGLTYQTGLSDELAYSLAGDVVHVFPEKRFYAGAGAEARFRELISLRAGYEFGSDARGITAGLGVAYSTLTLDYALARLRQDLGTAHTVTLGLAL